MKLALARAAKGRGGQKARLGIPTLSESLEVPR